MRRTPRTTYLWPGLPQVWTYGSWFGLAVALGGALVLDVLLLVSFGWSELIGSRGRIVLGVIFGGVWVAAAAWSAKDCRRRASLETPDAEADTFSKALDNYLRGDYYQAEQVLEDLLRRNARDVDARLMLATLMRRAGRREEALRQLDTLSRFENAVKWELEIRRERELLVEANVEKATAA